jgi:hypothetical protein
VKFEIKNKLEDNKKNLDWRVKLKRKNNFNKMKKYQNSDDHIEKKNTPKKLIIEYNWKPIKL